MAVVKIPAWPKGIAGNVWANKLADASLYAIESEVINYDTGTAIKIFSIPEDTILWSVGLEVVTIFNKPAAEIVVRDTAEVLGRFSGRALEQTGFVEQMLLKRYAKTAGPGRDTRQIQVDVNGGTGTAGVGRVWIVIKPSRRQSFKKDFS
mgnify:FL=1